MSQSEMERYEELLDDFVSDTETKCVTALTDTETNEQVILPGGVETIESPIQSSHVRVLIKDDGVEEQLVVQHVMPPNIIYLEIEPDTNTFEEVFKIGGEMALENACPLLVTVNRENGV